MLAQKLFTVTSETTKACKIRMCFGSSCARHTGCTHKPRSEHVSICLMKTPECAIHTHALYYAYNIPRTHLTNVTYFVCTQTRLRSSAVS